jgi:hypothetical protein
LRRCASQLRLGTVASKARQAQRVSSAAYRRRLCATTASCNMKDRNSRQGRARVISYDCSSVGDDRVPAGLDASTKTALTRIAAGGRHEAEPKLDDPHRLTTRHPRLTKDARVVRQTAWQSEPSQIGKIGPTNRAFAFAFSSSVGARRWQPSRRPRPSETRDQDEEALYSQCRSKMIHFQAGGTKAALA